MLKYLLNKGGAGVSFSRQETIERLTPLIRSHNELIVAYDQVARHLSDEETARQFDAFQKRNRTDAGKVSETILSAGGVPPLGTDIEPDSLELGTGDQELLSHLQEREQAFNDAVKTELAANHSLRTQAILGNVLAGSRERLDFFSKTTRQQQRVPLP